MPVSLPDLHLALKEWVSGLIRIDNWSLNDPSVSSTKLQLNNSTEERLYPSNTAICAPAEKITYTLENQGPVCTADFPFLIKYRFPKREYHEVPIFQAEGILNNLYYLAVNYFKEIHPDVVSISSPDIGVDVNLRPLKGHEEDTNEWVVVLQPAFRITFYADLASLDGLQPGDGSDSGFEFNSLSIGIYRADPEYPIDDIDNHILDDEITITAAELEEESI